MSNTFPVAFAEWATQASCVLADPEVFYPPSEAGPAARPAKAVCAGCPAREACLEDALNRGEKHGIWGGLTTHERNNLLRRLARRAA